MNILVVSQYFYPESFLLNDLVCELVKQGHKVTVLTGQPNYPSGKLFPGYTQLSRWKDNYQGALILRVPVFPRGQGRSWELALNYLSFIISAIFLGLPRILFSKVDIVFSWGTSPILQCLPALVFKVFRFKKTYLWVQDLWPETLSSVNMIQSKFILKLVGWVVSFIYKMTDFILIQSPAFEKSVVLHGGSPQKIHWIPNWSLITKTNQDFKVHSEFSPSHFNLLFAGNLGKAQSLETILLAAEILKDDELIQFHILGEGSEKKWFQKTSQEKGLTHIHFHKGCSPEEVPAYFSRSQALLVTLKSDSTLDRVIPSKIQTYLASGKPIIAAVSGQSQKTLTESQGALVGPSQNAETLAKNIKKLASYSDTKLDDMGNKGKLYYMKNFERNSVISSITQLFKRGLK